MRQGEPETRGDPQRVVGGTPELVGPAAAEQECVGVVDVLERTQRPDRRGHHDLADPPGRIQCGHNRSDHIPLSLEKELIRIVPEHRYRQYCGAARALDVVGDRWTLLIVRELMLGPRRFTDLLDGL